ncbi:hypothetical protein [Mesorhizobium sp. WSM2239]|uniref:Glycine zipper family protein n=2 Tax=unclassified Mesorhizobium TaxID=325217 RepID=A0AAU8DHA0_9HYPH
MARFAVATGIGIAVGAVLGAGFGAWMLNDLPFGIGIGMVFGAGTGALVSIAADACRQHPRGV